MSEYTINDESTDHKYFSQIPSVIYFIGLDPYQIALYVTIKCFSGDHSVCTKSAPNLAKCAGMSVRKLQQVALSLCEINKTLKKPLISILQRTSEYGDKAPNEIKIKDIWPENMKLSPGFMGGGAQYAPPPAQHAPPGAQGAPGVVHNMHQGGAPRADKQQSLNNTPFKKTTTPTPFKGDAVVGVVSKEIKEAAKSFKEWIDKEADKKRKRKIGNHYEDVEWGISWIIPIEVYENNMAKHGVDYFRCQLDYMIRTQIDFDKGKAKKPIDRPETYLNLACSRNYAEAKKK